MSDRPPTPPTPPTPQLNAIEVDVDADIDADDDGNADAASASASAAEPERLIATTPQLVDAIESATGCRVDDDVFEDLLVELDRQHVVEWVTVTQSGAIVWDLTATPDRIAEAITATVTDRIASVIER